jgi:hypothetical protein
VNFGEEILEKKFWRRNFGEEILEKKRKKSRRFLIECKLGLK